MARARRVWDRIESLSNAAARSTDGDEFTEGSEDSLDAPATGAPTSAMRDSLLHETRAAESALRDHLSARGGTTEDVLLLVKLHGVTNAIGVMGYLWSRNSDGLFDTEPYSTILERAVQADSLNPDLHYYLAQSLTTRSPDSTYTPNPRLGDAIRHLRTAVALKPLEEAYRASLAYQLLADGQFTEATRAYRDLQGGKHPAYVLLQEWERMPAVEGMKNLVSMAAAIPEAWSNAMDDGAVRIRTYLFPGKASELEGKYRKVWPTFRLTPIGGTQRPASSRRSLGQHLVWKADRLEVAPPAEGYPNIGDGGFWVQVVEVIAQERDRPEEHPGVKAGQTYCTVEIMNARPRKSVEMAK